MMNYILSSLIFLLLILPKVSFSDTGILFIAHGTMKHDSAGGDSGGHHLQEKMVGCHDTSHNPWEKYVLSTLSALKGDLPYRFDVAFGMWETSCYEEAIERLTSQMKLEGKALDHLIVFPLFISSASSVIEMQKFIFKLRPDRVLNIPNVHPISFGGKITYLNAIDYNPVISQILATRTQSLKNLAIKNGHLESSLQLVLVMHGPVEDAANIEWLKMGEKYNEDLRPLIPSGITHVVSLRDDAPADIRDAATMQLRKIVLSAKENGQMTLVLPLLVAKGGIEKGILKRLQGLSYIWTGETIFPDVRLKQMILDRILLLN